MKVSSMLLIAFFGLAIMSCKKDYYCSCDFSYEDGFFSSSGTYASAIPDAKKKDAEESCDALKADLEGDGYTATCTLSEL